MTSASRYRFELATLVDDAALRTLMSLAEMPGSVTLAFEREPSFFSGNQIYGDRCQTIVCRDRVSGSIVGVATRSSRLMFVDGQPTQIGYLGGLRFAAGVRGLGLLARGFGFLRNLHDSDPDPPAFYLTTIATSNEIAMRVLTGGRANLPHYHPIGTLFTIALTRRSLESSRFVKATCHDQSVISTTLADLPSIDPWLEFVTEMGRRRTFSPVHNRSILCSNTTSFVGLDLDSIVVFLRHGRIIATAGVWDQTSFRQTMVRGYHPLTRFFRPLLNVLSEITGGVVLPAIGSTFHAAYITMLAIQDEEPHLLKTLLRQLSMRSHCPNLLLGRCQGDPLLPHCLALSRTHYRTEIFAVNWNRTFAYEQVLGKLPYYLELGCL